MTDYDHRLVDLYDVDNPDGPDHDFYRALGDEISAESVLDLGCGTGILTVTFLGNNRQVVGIDPSQTMINYARQRNGAGGVNWILGDSRAIPSGTFDYAVMTGNVAQHISNHDWETTLRDLRQSLKRGGTLAFESRNPATREWESWVSEERTTRETAHGELVEWMDLSETTPGTIELQAHNLFVDANETITETLTLVFRDRHLLEQQLSAAGFTVEAVYGDWKRTPFVDTVSLMVFVARAR